MRATTVAVRCPVRTRPISPNVSPGPRTWGRLATVSEHVGLSLFDEVDGGSVVVERDDFGIRFDLDFAYRGGELIELRRRKIGQGRECRDPTRVHDPDRAIGNNHLGV